MLASTRSSGALPECAQCRGLTPRLLVHDRSHPHSLATPVEEPRSAYTARREGRALRARPSRPGVKLPPEDGDLD